MYIIKEETRQWVGGFIILFIIIFLAALQARTQTIGYLAVKDSGRYTLTLKTTEIDSVVAFIGRDIKKEMSKSNLFKYETDDTYIYVERKRVVFKQRRGRVVTKFKRL